MTEQAEHIYDLFISYAGADRAWVEGYLLDGLTGAGARCHSEAAFAPGVPRLLEFERAIRQSQRTLLILSPAYLAEGLSQFTDLLAQSYGLETATWPVIPLVLHPVELPPRLAMLTQLDATDSTDWPAVIQRLCAELQRAVPGIAPRLPCPYPGMVPFSEADSDRFFGRDREVQELLERLRLHPFMTVIGPSGSGKSSLVFAGLAPALRESGLFGPGGWLVRALRPGEAPLAALSAALDGDPSTGFRQAQPGSSGQAPTNPAQAVSELLRTVRSDDFSRPGLAATKIATTNNRLLLVVDQFEELFTLARADVEPFQQALLRLAETPNCYVVLTARADFYPELMSSSLWPEIQAHRFEVLPLDEDGLRQAIVRPAEDAGVFVETALVERLLADAGGEPGILPLAQETLVLLWEKVERRFLPLRAYEALTLTRRAYGAPPLTGLQVAMAYRADIALTSLTPKQHAIARRIFLRLVQFGEGRADTRRQQPVGALCTTGEDPLLFEQTLRHLAHKNNRLLTLSGAEGDSDRRVDIAHEALISGWPTLQEWLAERREAEQTRRRMEAKATEWVRLGRGNGGLLDKVELLEVQHWVDSPDGADLGYGETLPALVEASRAAIEQAERKREAARQRELAQARALAKEQQRRAEAEHQRAEEQTRASRRLRVLAGVLAVVFLLALGAAIAARIQAVRSERLRRVSLAQALAAQVSPQRQLNQDELSALLAHQAYVFNQRSQQPVLTHVDSALRTALRTPYFSYILRHGKSWHSAIHENQYYSVAFSHDGHMLAAGSYIEVVVWDLRQPGSVPIILRGLDGSISGVAFSPDDQTLAASSDRGTVYLWERCQLGTAPVELAGYGNEYADRSVAFSPDGQTLALGSAEGVVLLWDLRRISTPPTVLRAGNEALTFSPNSKTLITGSYTGTVLLWDLLHPGALPIELTAHTKQVNSVALSPDGQTLVTSSHDDTMQLWDLRHPGTVPTALTGVRPGVTSVTFSPDGQTLAASNWDGTVQLWNLSHLGAAPIELTGHSGGVSAVAFSPYGRTLASASYDRTVRLWDLHQPEADFVELLGHEGAVNSVAFSPNGQTLASGSDDKGSTTVGSKPASHRFYPPAHQRGSS